MSLYSEHLLSFDLVQVFNIANWQETSKASEIKAKVFGLTRGGWQLVGAEQWKFQTDIGGGKEDHRPENDGNFHRSITSLYVFCVIFINWFCIGCIRLAAFACWLFLSTCNSIGIWCSSQKLKRLRLSLL